MNKVIDKSFDVYQLVFCHSCLGVSLSLFSGAVRKRECDMLKFKNKLLTRLMYLDM